MITLFNLFDRDGNGRISRIELRVTLNSVYPEGVSEKDVDELLDATDINKDGQIDPMEFMELMKKHRE